MKTIVIPLRSITSLELPIDLYSEGDDKVSLHELSRQEIEDIFGYRISDNPDGSHSYYVKTSTSLISPKGSIMHDLASSTLKVVVESSNDSRAELLKDEVIFLLRCLIAEKGDFMGVQHIISDDDLSWGTLISGNTTVLRRSVNEINQANISDIQELMEILHQEIHDRIKIKTLKALLYTAMQQVGAIDVSCAFYISVLEALFVSENSNSEIAYKLSMRCTRKYKGDEEFLQKLRRAYAGRSKVFHGSQKGSVFTHADNEFLEGLAVRSLLDYLRNRQDFDDKKLDSLLLDLE